MIAAGVTERNSNETASHAHAIGLRAITTQGIRTYSKRTHLPMNFRSTNIRGPRSNRRDAVRANETIINRSDSAGLANQNPTRIDADSGLLEQKI